MAINSINNFHNGHYDPISISLQDQFCALCQTETLQEVKAALKTGGVDIHSYSEFGMTPLMHACCNGKIEIVQYLLLKKGAKINDQGIDEAGKMTALSWACMGGYIEIVQMLLIYGAKQLPDASGLTPLHLVTKYGKNSLMIAGLLLSVGEADLTATTHVDETVLHMAILNENLELLNLYLRIHKRRLANHVPPLSEKKQREKYNDWLNQTTKTLPIKTENGVEETIGNFTVLHIAASIMCKTNNQTFAKILLQEGADPQICDANYVSPMDIFDEFIADQKGKEMEEYKEILNLLKPHRIDPNDDHYDMDDISITEVP